MTPFMTKLVIGLGGVLGIVVIFWLMLRAQSKKRASDRRNLSSSAKKIYNQARKIGPRDPRSAARLLESIQLHREAIDLLEATGHIKEAANILGRLGRPNRAGKLYLRHGMWEAACKCFEKANMPKEVVRCARKIGNLKLAVKYLEQLQDWEQLADVYLEMGKHAEAAKLYVKINRPTEALRLYPIILDSVSDIKSLNFSSAEIALIKKSLVEGPSDPRLIDVLGDDGGLPEVIYEVIKRNATKKALDFYLRSPRDIGRELIGFDNLDKEENRRLAEMFDAAGSFEYAGMVFERIEMFREAGESFGNAEEYERAAYCFDRAGLKSRSVDMRCMIAATGSPSAKKPAKKAPTNDTGTRNPFLMEATQSEFAQKAALPPPQEFQSKEDTNPLAQNPSTYPPAFEHISIFSDLSSEQINQIWALGKECHYQPGENILKYGTIPDGFYFIMKGEVRCERQNKTDVMHAPGIFGEFWLLIERPTEVQFSARTQVWVQRIDRDPFQSLLDKNGTIARKIYKKFTQRLLTKLLTNENKSSKHQEAS